MSSPFEKWKANMLRERGLRHPDSRPLYAYRLEISEFKSLESLLRNKLSQYMNAQSLFGSSTKSVGTTWRLRESAKCMV